MKKIEQAAREFALEYVGEDSAHFNSMCLAFRGGARYVLRAMTSENTINVAFLTVADLRRHEAKEILAAIRKEIEG